MEVEKVNNVVYSRKRAEKAHGAQHENLLAGFEVLSNNEKPNIYHMP